MAQKIDRTGEIRIMNNGQKAQIIKYDDYMHILVRFENGVVMKTDYNRFKSGNLGNKKLGGEDIKLIKIRQERLGERKMMSCGLEATIIEYNNAKNVKVRFSNGYEMTTDYQKFKSGALGTQNPDFLSSIRVGLKKRMNCGLEAEIIDCKKNGVVVVKFEDGYIRDALFSKFCSGDIVHKDFRNKLSDSYIKNKNSRIGEKEMMNNGMLAEIIDYRSSGDIDVKFADGTVVTTKYRCFKNGGIKNPNYLDPRLVKTRDKRLGEIIVSKDGRNAKIIEYNNADDITIQFDNGEKRYNQKYHQLKKGIITENFDPSKRLGEVFTSNFDGSLYTIIDYINEKNITVKFDTGEIISHVAYSVASKGLLRKRNFRYYGYKIIKNIYGAYYLCKSKETDEEILTTDEIYNRVRNNN